MGRWDREREVGTWEREREGGRDERTVKFHVGEQVKHVEFWGRKRKERPTTGSPRGTHTDNEGQEDERLFIRRW